MRALATAIDIHGLRALHDAQLVEVLPAEEYEEEHLPGAINLPPDRVRELASRVLPDKGAEIIVYCSSPT